MTSSQVPTQPQRSNDTPTMRIQPVPVGEPAWPTAEPMTARDLTPVAAVTTKLQRISAPPIGQGMSGLLPTAPERPAPAVAPGAPAGFGVPAPVATPAPTVVAPAVPAPLVPAPTVVAPHVPAPTVPAPTVVAPPPASAPAQPAVDVSAAPTVVAAPVTPAVHPAPAASASAVTAAKPATAAATTSRNRWRRIARKIVGPTLLTKKG
ncbi:hypothetical protein Q5530_04410 [Saccharothrix sp. BKS2]|uniref:hypothetical protein n=1 Tax=Saccharothrix sp. BKS2 TaxID=3064400 RepID=UPI0039E7EC4C